MGSIKMRANLGTRAFGYRQELMKLRCAIPFEAFCDIGHDRYRRPLYLT